MKLMAMRSIGDQLRLESVRCKHQLSYIKRLARYPTPVKQFGKILVLTILLLAGACNTSVDRSDARDLAARIHAQMIRGQYSSIYNQSAQRFKTVGSESEFNRVMDSFHSKVGSIRTMNEISYESSQDSNTGRLHVLIFNLHCEYGEARERMVFKRSESGEMKLWKLDLEAKD